MHSHLTPEQEQERQISKKQLSQFKKPKLMTDDITARLLQESILTNGKYFPSEIFKKSNSVAITLDGKPIILLGWENDSEAQALADRLLSNAEFINLVGYEYGANKNLSKTVVANSEACPGDEYFCIAESKQGTPDGGEATGMVVSVLPQNNTSFSFGICINSSIMLCFYPTAKPLSIQVILSAD